MATGSSPPPPPTPLFQDSLFYRGTVFSLDIRPASSMKGLGWYGITDTVYGICTGLVTKTNPFFSKEPCFQKLVGIVQRILRGVGTAKLETPQIFILNFEGTPSQEEHKTIYSGLSEINLLYLAKLTVRCFLKGTLYFL
jgi:hypothetical protein